MTTSFVVSTSTAGLVAGSGSVIGTTLGMADGEGPGLTVSAMSCFAALSLLRRFWITCVVFDTVLIRGILRLSRRLKTSDAERG